MGAVHAIRMGVDGIFYPGEFLSMMIASSISLPFMFKLGVEKGRLAYLIMVGVILIAMPFVNYAMHPAQDKAITINPALLVDEEEKKYEVETPADKMEHSKILWVIVLLFGFIYIISYFVGVVKAGKSVAGALGLNIVNMTS